MFLMALDDSDALLMAPDDSDALLMASDAIQWDSVGLSNIQ